MSILWNPAEATVVEKVSLPIITTGTQNMGDGIYWLKAGTPLDEDLAVANNGGAMYIVAEDFFFVSTNPNQDRSVPLVKSGYVDAVKAQEAAGIVYTADCLSALKDLGLSLVDSVNGDAASGEVVYQEPELLVDTATVSFAKDGDNNWYVADISSLGLVFDDLSFDARYRVTWDGEEYALGLYYLYEPKSLATTADTLGKTIGSISSLGYSEVESIQTPFLLKYSAEASLGSKAYAFDSTAATHTIKIEVVPYAKVIPPEEFVVPTYKNLAPFRQGTGSQSIIAKNAKNAVGDASFAVGTCAEAGGAGSVAIGSRVKASGHWSFASGFTTTASGMMSHSEGSSTEASGQTSHAEGSKTVASGKFSHAEARGTIANHLAQSASGMFNVADPSAAAGTERGDYVEIVGNGTDEDHRSNARTLDWSGNESLAGGITLGKGTADETTLTATQLKALLALLS